MFLTVRTVAMTIDHVQAYVRLYRKVKAFLHRERMRRRLLERRAERASEGSRRKACFGRAPPLALRAERLLEAFKIDSGLVPHGHLRPLVSSPCKVDGGSLPESGNEKRRSPGPLPSEVSHNGQVLQLSPESNSQQTAQWLRKNSFGNYVSTFANFSGADILRLTRDDLIQICGLADGIRLLYALHSKAIVRLTLYICTPSSAVYHAVYLDHVGRNEMSRKLAALLGVHQNQIHDVFLQGPNDIRVLVTDEVVSNIKDESMFSIEVLKDETRGRFVLVLKPAPASN